MTSPAWTNQVLGNSVTIVSRGDRPGYESTFVRSNIYNFYVDSLSVEPQGIFTNNPVWVTITNQTTNTLIYWTIDGSKPSPSNPAATTPFPQNKTSNLPTRRGKEVFSSPAHQCSVSHIRLTGRPVHHTALLRGLPTAALGGPQVS